MLIFRTKNGIIKPETIKEGAAHADRTRIPGAARTAQACTGAGTENRTPEPAAQTAVDPDREPDTGAPSCKEEAVRPFHGSHTDKGTDEPVRTGRTAAFP